MHLGASSRPARTRGLFFALAVAAMFLFAAPAGATSLSKERSVGSLKLPSGHQTTSKTSFGELDCNGFSPNQESVQLTMACTDIRGDNRVSNKNTWDGRFYDNGHYIGHDEPDMTFLSSQPGSGNNVVWTETLGTDPATPPTDSVPGSDVSHWFQLSIAPWFSMAMCDGNSYPQTPCTPKSDANAPTCLGAACGAGTFVGGGSAFMEMQFYPPGFSPLSTAVSCDNSHWCAAITIDSLECTQNFVQCNPQCEEPVNAAFIQRNGIPTGPPSPQNANISTRTPNGQTLLMNPGDKVQVHMFDAPVPGEPGQHAFEVVINDKTTGQSGFMQASAANGFMNTSIIDCSGTPFNFEPEYNTAARNNINPWGADQVDISTQFETGHWESCQTLLNPFKFPTADLGIPGATDKAYQTCIGPYENQGPPDDTSLEVSDALCYPAGDTHGSLASDPDITTGCLDDFFQNGDLDFDGTPYYPEWPTSTTAGVNPGSFVQALPTTGGQQYSRFFIQTDLGLSESYCPGNTAGGPGNGTCNVPPTGPGNFYPYWTRVVKGSKCTLEFGNVSKAPPGSTIRTFGKFAQYGTVQTETFGYPQFIGPIRNNACT